MTAENAEAVFNDARALIEIGQRVHEAGLVPASAGNLSARTAGGIWVTGRRARLGELTPSDLYFIHDDGRVEGSGEAGPTSESQLHRAVHAVRNTRFVVHTHSKAAVAASLLCNELPNVHYTAAMIGDVIPVVDYEPFGSEELAFAVGRAFSAGRNGAVLRHHGAVTIGDSLTQAVDRAILLDWLADLSYSALASGSTRRLSPEQMAHAAERMRVQKYSTEE
ncbi:class II aldolase/adducin family protein [Diaminobutyricibacter sp. McL0618]|uniref:class II aldolase/adducin family protein n=1 Tax=Leifsonia sp. McL0618 TaxID=3415677 RepID=UPI003CFAF19C